MLRILAPRRAGRQTAPTDSWSRARGRPLVLAHRGASADAPENTMAAFALAAALGADGFELDVRRCASGEVVVHHDADTWRTTGIRLAVRETSLHHLRRLDAGSWKGEAFRGERIPLLAEVLERFPGQLLNVELKAERAPALVLARSVARLVRGAQAGERILVSSFDPLTLAAFRAAAPAVRTGLLVDDERGWRLRTRLGLLALRPAAVHPRHTLVTAARARRWIEEGLLVNAWTVDAPADARRLRDLGVAALVTNRPRAILAALEATGEERPGA